MRLLRSFAFRLRDGVFFLIRFSLLNDSSMAFFLLASFGCPRRDIDCWTSASFVNGGCDIEIEIEK